MRSLLLALASLASCGGGGQNSQEFSHEMHAVKAIANIHTAEAQFQSRTGRYGSLKELHLELPDEWSFALSLTPGSGYTIAVRAHDTHSYGFFSDQTTEIRRCPPGTPGVSSPTVARHSSCQVF
jgi:hypothetical protein